MAKPEGRVDRLKVPPNSIEAEQAVIGGLMLDPDSIERVGDLLIEEDFYRRDHRLLYRAIRELSEKNKPFDAVTLGEWLEANNLAEQVGGSGYLIELASTTPSAANIRAYAEIVREKSVLRQLIDVGTEIVNDGFKPDGRESREVVSAAEMKVFRIAEHGNRGRVLSKPINEVMRESFLMLQDRYEAGGAITGIPTEFHELDEMTSGLQNTDLIIIAARPSLGKTALAMQMASVAAIRYKKAVAVYSMEMSAAQLGLRLISSLGRIDSKRLRNGQLEDEDWSKVNLAIKSLAGTKLFIDDSPALSPDELRARARRLKREHDIGLIVVDYLQLMQVPGNDENRATEVSEISRSLKALAKELNVPVIALSQLNRAVEQRTDKRPVMADLRESGSIEQDADVIMFIYRDDYYHRDSEDKGVAEIIISKQRSGPTGTVKLRFFGEWTRFESPAKDHGGGFE